MNKSVSFNQFIDRVWREHRLFSAVLELTYACNLDCRICYNDVNLRGRALMLAQYRQLLSDLAGMNVMSVTLSGGEPLAHPDFYEIGREARNLGFMVRIKTNGHGLRRSVAERIQSDIDPYSIDISLHGATAETHDRQTQVAGSFRQLLDNLEVINSLGLRFRLNVPVTRWNENELDGMAAIAEKYDALINFDPDITPRDDGDLAPLTMAPTREGIRKTVQMVEQLRVKRSKRQPAASSGHIASASPTEMFHPETLNLPEKHCGAGSSTITVDPFGAVYPCVQWRCAVGNLHEQSIIGIWEHSTALADVREQNSRAKRMIDQTDGAENSRFCIGRAVQENHNAVQFYPLAQLTMQLQRATKSLPQA